MVSSEPFFKLKEGFRLDVEAHESQCGLCAIHVVANGEKKKAKDETVFYMTSHSCNFTAFLSKNVIFH